MGSMRIRVSCFWARLLETGKVFAPEDGPVSWTTHPDLAAAAVIALTEEGRLDGITPPLTASDTLDMEGIAAIVSELTGRKTDRVTVTDEQYRDRLLSHGLPEERATMLVGLFAASREMAFAAVDPTLEHLLGRPPMSMRDMLANRLSSEQKV